MVLYGPAVVGTGGDVAGPPGEVGVAAAGPGGRVARAVPRAGPVVVLGGTGVNTARRKKGEPEESQYQL